MKSEDVVKDLIRIEVQTRYLDSDSHPEKNQFVFSYRIRISNQESHSLQLISRHWYITNSFGITEEIQGLGVVGLQPQIEPGDTFEYESLCPLLTSTGSMKGYYHFVTEKGDKISIPIPEFFLVAPQSLH